MESQIHESEKKFRSRALNMFGEAKLNAFMEEQLGRTVQVLFERRNKQGLFEGYSSNFIRVMVDTEMDLSNQIHSVLLKEIVGEKVFGELIQTIH